MRAALAHLAVGLAERKAGRAALDDERRDRRPRPSPRVGARHHREDAGLGRVGDVALGAVERRSGRRRAPRVVASDAASEPEPGSVSANEPISSPLASRGS